RTSRDCYRSTKTFACRTIPIARNAHSRNRWRSGSDRFGSCRLRQGYGGQESVERLKELKGFLACHVERGAATKWKARGQARRTSLAVGSRCRKEQFRDSSTATAGSE